MYNGRHSIVNVPSPAGPADRPADLDGRDHQDEHTRFDLIRATGGRPPWVRATAGAQVPPSRGGYGEPWPPVPAGYAQPAPEAPGPRRKRRIFLWVFLAIQAAFMLWIIVGLATVHTGPSAQDVAEACYGGHWHILFKSQADCVTHYGHALAEAGDIGKGLGVAVIAGLWVALDIILGIGFMVVRLAKR
jgi:hypothetical protein